jgi:adenylate cyclase
MVAEGAKEIRLPVGKGIAGTVAANGEVINIPDAYQDSRFNPENDKKTGYKTNTILCAPVMNGKRETTGVLQAINCSKGPFSDVDEEVVGILAAQAGIALHNAHIYHLSVRSREKVKSLLDVIRAMHSDLGINSLMFTITQRTHTLVDADRGTLFLVDNKTQELWSMQGEVNIRIPKTAGIAGTVATSGETINIPDAYADPRFNKEVDKKSGYRTNTILCMPIRGDAASGGEVVGVIQVINKKMGVFDEEDENIMDSFLSIAGPILQHSQLFQRSESTSGNEFSGKSMVRKPSGQRTQENVSRLVRTFIPLHAPLMRLRLHLRLSHADDYRGGGGGG